MNVYKVNFALDLSMHKLLPPFYGRITNKHSQVTLQTENKEVKINGDRPLYVIMDIPDFIDVARIKDPGPYAQKSIQGYKGFAIDLRKHQNIEDLFRQSFSRNPRKNFRAKWRKLEARHSISYKFYYGEIEREEYNRLFVTCYHLLKARFNEKKIYNRYLLDWGHYHEFFLPKLLKKEASIFVIYDGEKPITITLNLHIADIVFSFIQVFDVNYSQYSLGDIAMYSNLEWCYANDYCLWDTSKGETENKIRWSNSVYRFEHHIFYIPNRPVDQLFMKLTILKIRFKDWLRDTGVIGGWFQLDRIFYYIKGGKINKHDWKVP